MTELTDDRVRALLDGVAQNPPRVCMAWCGKAKDDCDCYKAGVAVNALSDAAPDLARALLDARAELAHARADAQAAVAVVVEKAAERLDANRAHLNFAALLGLLRDEALSEPVVTALSDWLDGIAAAIRALAPADDLAAVEALRERAEKAEQERDRIDQWRETAIVERDTYSEERDAAEGRVAALTEALGDMVGLFSADNVLRKGTHMNATLKLARAALAQTPTDPGDGWTWNERLGWIGPDGKPAGRGGA